MTSLAAVVRVSHMGSRKAGADDFRADAEQTAEINAYAATLGARVTWMPPELDVSGGAPLAKRPGLLAAIEGVERGEFDGIIVAYLKRLTRSRSGHEIWERVEAAGGTVYCARERLDTSTVSGRRMRDYLIADAVAEREEHAEQHAARRRTTVERGIWRQRQTPLGYTRGEKPNRSLYPDDRADDVRWAFKARAAGTSLTTIAERLGMTTSGVRKLLANKVYLGILRDGENVNETAHEPLIDRGTFEAAQVDVARPARAENLPPALLAGLVRCASCGHVMSRKRTASVVYGCAGLHSGERCPGPASVTAEKVDVYVERIARAELERLSATASGGQDVEAAKAKLDDAEFELAAFLEHATARDHGFAGALAKRRSAVELARQQYQAEMGRAGFSTTASTAAELWDVLNGHERNQLLRSLLEAVVVSRAGGRGARVPLEDRVRVVAFGTGLDLPQGRGGRAAGIRPLVIDADAPGVLREPRGEDRV